MSLYITWLHLCDGAMKTLRPQIKTDKEDRNAMSRTGK